MMHPRLRAYLVMSLFPLACSVLALSDNQPSGVSNIQVLHAPDDIVTAGDCKSRNTSLAVRATQAGVTGLRIVGGGLTDPDSKHKLPASAFSLESQVDGEFNCQTVPFAATAAVPNAEITRIYIFLERGWIRPGSYSGDLLLAAQGDTMPQTVALKVYVRPRWAWWAGASALLLGTVLSWVATVWLVRHRHLTANELLVTRLGSLLDNLKKQLENLPQPSPPHRQQTIDHIDKIKEKKLKQLYDDKVLAVLGGIEAPSSPEPTVLDEIESVLRVVQDGFVKLSAMWQNNLTQEKVLSPFFSKLDDQGGSINSKAAIETNVKQIVDEADDKLKTLSLAPRAITADYAPQQEAAIVQRLVRSTYWLDLVSIALVVVVGVYVTIWKNPGFGTLGDVLIAFTWGLGLKLGTDTARLGPGEVRTTLGIKVPSA